LKRGRGGINLPDTGNPANSEVKFKMSKKGISKELATKLAKKASTLSYIKSTTVKKG
jgi:hypothetical protein